MSTATSAIDALETCVDDLFVHNLCGRSFREVATHLQRLEVLRHRLEAASTFTVAALKTAWQEEPATTELTATASHNASGDMGESVNTKEDAVIAHAHAATSSTVALMHLLHLDPPAAKARLRMAEALGTRQTLTGNTLPAVFPAVAHALAEGVISPDHAVLITRTIHALPHSVALLHASNVETDLVALSRELTVREVTTCAQRILDALDPDGAQPSHEQQQRDRYLSLHTRRDGSAELRARLTPEAVAVWDAIFDSLAQPAVTTSQTGSIDDDAEEQSSANYTRVGDSQPASNTAGTIVEHDDRSTGQRHHDAFLDAGHRLLRDGGLPNTGGAPVTLVFTLTADELAAGAACTPHGTRIPLPEVLTIADEADIMTVLANHNGRILSVGRDNRCATPTQRRALIARDRGCTFPGCTTPATWTQVHHVTPWSEGGTTALDNLTLVCGHHHRNFEKYGWTVHMRSGVPWWTPPKWADPAQQPRQNPVHHRHTRHERSNS